MSLITHHPGSIECRILVENACNSARIDYQMLSAKIGETCYEISRTVGHDRRMLVVTADGSRNELRISDSIAWKLAGAPRALGERLFALLDGGEA